MRWYEKGVKIIMEVKAGVRISLILGLLKNKYRIADAPIIYL